MTGAGKAAAFLLAVALTVCACHPEKKLAPLPQPNGTRLPLRAGHWTGGMGETYVNFNIDRVSAFEVAININGGLSSPTARNTPGHPVTFTDRPVSCKVNPDGVSFDCLRYKDMHIDNGLLCGTYILREQVYRPCFFPLN